jgi:hypothetical protein
VVPQRLAARSRLHAAGPTPIERSGSAFCMYHRRRVPAVGTARRAGPASTGPCHSRSTARGDPPRRESARRAQQGWPAGRRSFLPRSALLTARTPAPPNPANPRSSGGSAVTARPSSWAKGTARVRRSQPSRTNISCSHSSSSGVRPGRAARPGGAGDRPPGQRVDAAALARPTGPGPGRLPGRWRRLSRPVAPRVPRAEASRTLSMRSLEFVYPTRWRMAG